MKLYRVKRKIGTEINMAPMIDVVFLLIIFSMLVTQFSRVDAESVKLPEAVSGEASKPEKIKPLVINIRKDGTIIFSNTIHTEQTLKGALAKAIKGQAKADVHVLLRSDRKAQWKPARIVLRTCATLGIWKVNVAVLESP
jgi:biopolymer transport protein ExbD